MSPLEQMFRAMIREVVGEIVAEKLAEERPRLIADLKAERPDAQMYLTAAEAAELAGVSADTVRGWVRDGKLQRFSAGGRAVRIASAELHAFLERGCQSTQKRLSNPRARVAEIIKLAR